MIRPGTRVRFPHPDRPEVTAHGEFRATLHNAGEVALVLVPAPPSPDGKRYLRLLRVPMADVRIAV